MGKNQNKLSNEPRRPFPKRISQAPPADGAALGSLCIIINITQITEITSKLDSKLDYISHLQDCQKAAKRRRWKRNNTNEIPDISRGNLIKQ